MRGELDWIVMKALEKDRTRRYETANGLARDVQRYLDDEPVEACPPSAGYRLRKFARKHRRRWRRRRRSPCCWCGGGGEHLAGGAGDAGRDGAERPRRDRAVAAESEDEDREGQRPGPPSTSSGRTCCPRPAPSTSRTGT